MESILALAGLHPEGESERGFRLECGGGRLGVEACGDRLTPDGGIAAWSHYLERVGMVEDLTKRFPAGRTRPNSTPFRQSGHQKTFKPASRKNGGQPSAKPARGCNAHAKFVVLHRELIENLLLRCFAASREIPDPISRRWMSNKLSSVLCVGTTRSAHKIGWLTHRRDIPTAGFRMKPAQDFDVKSPAR
jgi:hypothetical protein